MKAKTADKKGKIRYNIIDSLRGFAAVNMVLYHVLWSFVYIFGGETDIFPSSAADIWERIICFLFIFISGFCSGLSENRSPARGTLVLGCGCVITILTFVITPDFPNRFGILMLLGLSMTAFSLLSERMKKIDPLWGGAVSGALFVALYNINQGKIGFGSFSLSLPMGLYRNDFTACIGFPYEDYTSADYFPLLPWVFLFALGYFVCRQLFRKGRTGFLGRGKRGFLSFAGRHSLELYLIHEPVILLMLRVFMTLKKG